MLVSGNVVYPHRRDLGHRQFYLCKPCDAYVGVHVGTTKPLGRLANRELRLAKMAAHAAFDPLWRGQGHKKRKEAYGWLADTLGIEREDCHIGRFDVPLCLKTVDICEAERKERWNNSAIK